MLSLLRAIEPSSFARGSGRASPASAAVVAVTEDETRAAAATVVAGALVATAATVVRSGVGGSIRAVFGISAKPRSISRATSALRAPVEDPPISATITRLLPRCAEDTRLKPAALV